MTRHPTRRNCSQNAAHKQTLECVDTVAANGCQPRTCLEPTARGYSMVGDDVACSSVGCWTQPRPQLKDCCRQPSTASSHWLPCALTVTVAQMHYLIHRDAHSQALQALCDWFCPRQTPLRPPAWRSPSPQSVPVPANVSTARALASARASGRHTAQRASDHRCFSTFVLYLWMHQELFPAATTWVFQVRIRQEHTMLPMPPTPTPDRQHRESESRE